MFSRAAMFLRRLRHEKVLVRKKTTATSLRDYLADNQTYRLSISDLADNTQRDLVKLYAEQRCAYVPMPQERVLCKVLGKYLMWVDANDKGLGPHLMFQGYWEMWVTSAVARFARRGTTAIDVGANVGYYTLIMADAVGPEGKVIAFEPNPRIAEMIRMSAPLNGYRSRVSVRPEAVSAKCGDGLAFAIPTQDPKNARLLTSEVDRRSMSKHYGENVKFVDVPEISLDSLALTNLSVIKIDAEGEEANIWDGMQATIDSNPQVCIIMEINCGRKYDAISLCQGISERFQLRHVDHDGDIKPLTLKMLETERQGSDWMLFLKGD